MKGKGGAMPPFFISRARLCRLRALVAELIRVIVSPRRLS
jgi:hypothetical protein